MKTERVTLLTTPDFKTFLTKRAAHEGISVAELIRRRFEAEPTGEDVALVELTGELRGAVVQAKRSLADGLAQVQAVLSGLRGEPSAVAARAGRPARRARRA